MSEAAAAPADPGATIRSKSYRVLLVLAAVIGVLVSFASWCFLELLHWIQTEVYQSLPSGLGFHTVPWWWPLPVLAVSGVLTAVAIVRLPGRGGHIPYEGIKAGTAKPAELPGILLTVITLLLTSKAGIATAPLIIVAVVVAYLTIETLSAARGPAPAAAPAAEPQPAAPSHTPPQPQAQPTARRDHSHHALLGNMTDQPDQELPPAKRKRLIIGAVLRGLVVATVLVVLYYLLPLDRPLDTGTAVRLLIGLLVFTGLAVWQVKAIAGSRYPGLRAAEALGLIIPLYLLLFASTYFLMERASAANFTQSLTRTGALYFSVTVFTTVGFGDIAARSETARVLLIIQMLADLALLGVGARVLLAAVQRGQQRRSGTGDGDGPPAS